MRVRSDSYQSLRLTLSVVLVCTLLVVCVGPADAQSVALDDAATAASLRSRSVTVLPFDNISGAAADEWIGTGIAETVAADLEQFGGLSVVSRDVFLDVVSGSDVADREPTLALTDSTRAREVALDLGVAWIVTGGFQRLGDQMRLTARIVNVETGTSSEAVKIDGRLDQLFDLQDRVVNELRAGFTAIAGTSDPAPTVATRDSGPAQTELGEGVGTEGFTGPLSPRGRGPGPTPRRESRPSGNGDSFVAVPAYQPQCLDS